jgi:F-type H+-transporting ATPase subunit a
MVTGWATSLFIIVLFMVLVGKASILPSRGQALVEALIEMLRGVFEPIVGKRAFPASFPLLMCLFIFILINNWMGLIPGVGTIGWGHDVDGKFEVTRALIRPHNSDFNSTIALALISFGAYLIIVLKYAGPKAIIYDLFGNKADRKETPLPLYVALSLIFLLVGVIEVFSIVIRPFTLSVRLFGNVYGGENLMHGTHFLFVFYFMEALVGLIQAFVFTLLSAVYIGLLCNHGDEHQTEGGHPAEAHH